MNKISIYFQRIRIWGILLVIPVLPACTHDPQFIDEIEPVCFNTEVLPMLQSSCGTSGCHASSGHETAFSTRDYNSVMTIVKPGDAKGSEIYKVVTALYGEHVMPPERPLTERQRNLLMVWIEQGAENTQCSTDTTGTISGTSQSDTICFTKHIQPLIVSSCATTTMSVGELTRKGTLRYIMLPQLQ